MGGLRPFASIHSLKTVLAVSGKQKDGFWKENKSKARETCLIKNG